MGQNDRNAQLNELLTLTSDWYWEQDAALRYTYLSDRYYAISGLTPAQIIGTRRWDHVALNMDEAAWGRHRASLDARERFHELELGYAPSGGDVRWCSVSGVPVFEADGRFAGYRGLARDITERKLAEAEQARVRRQLEMAMEAGRFGIWEADLVAHRVYFSPAWSQILGGEPIPTNEDLGVLVKLSHPDDLDRLLALQLAAMRGESEGYECTHRVRHRDGSWRWIFSRGQISERGPDGRALRMTGTNIDITAEINAQEALGAKEAEMRRVLDSVPMMICRMDRDRRYVYANIQYAQFLGHAQQEIVGRTARKVIGEERAAANEGLVRRVLAGEDVQYTHQMSSGPATGRHFDVRMVPDRAADGAVQGYYALMTEFTETKRAQAEIQNKERELRHLLDSLPAIVAHLGPDNRYTYANNLFAAAYGLAPERIVGSVPGELVTNELASQFPAFRRRVTAGETVSYERELLDGQGARRNFHLHLIPEFDAKGVVCGAYVFGIDITERMAQERRAADLLNQLTDANRELESFAYTVSHDLRAPLRAIGGFADILERDAAAGLAAPAQQHLSRISANALRMTQLIDGLLRLSKLARQSMEKRPTSPASLVREVIADHEGELAVRDIRLTVRELPECNADPVLLKQVYANLIGNAFKYTGRRATAEIEIGARRVDDQTVYYVRDNGAGFDMAYADKLFGVFQRLHSDKEFLGTGIGLATVKRIVERHEGRIWAESVEDRGATFYFTLGG